MRMNCTRLNIYPLFGFVCLLGSVAATSGNSTFSIQKFENSPIAYVERIGASRIVNGDWNILVYYDLKNYFNEFNAIREGVTQIKEKCVEAGLDCAALAITFEHRLRGIQENNELLLNERGEMRSKRHILAAIGLGGLAFGGGALYTWLTKSEGDDYAKAIEDLKSNQDQMKKLIDAQTSVIEMTNDANKRNIGEWKKEHENLHHTINALDRAQKDAWQLHNAALQYLIMLGSYADFQSRIIDAAMTVHHGTLRTEVISPTKMREQIALIRAHLGPEFELPKTLRSVYQMASVKVRLVDDMLIFRVAIPVLRVSPFQMWRIIPIPQASNQLFMEIRPKTEYLLVNDGNETYFELTELEFNACSNIEGQVICRIRHPSYKFDETVGRCEIELVRNATSNHTNCQMQTVALEERWTQLNDIHSWIFALDRERTYNLSCAGFTKTITLTGMGLLYLNGNCSFEGESMRIFTNQLETEMITGYVISSNISVNFNRAEAIHDMPMALANTTALDAAVQELKKNSSTKLLDISVHDWHQYCVIYGFILGAIVFHRMRQQKKPKTDAVHIHQNLV